MACTTITCAFASCGDEKEESSANDTSVSESGEEETTTEEATEAVTEEETTEPETEDEEVSQFVGKWQGVKIVEDGEESDIYEDVPVYALFQIEFYEDGSVDIGGFTSEKVQPTDALWSWTKTNDTQVELFSDDDDMFVITLDGDYLIMDNEYRQIYFERVDEFTPYQSDEETELPTHEYLEDADKTPFVGKWQGEKVEFEGETVTDVMGLPVSVLYQFDIREDGTVALGEGLLSIIGEAPSFTWGVISEDEIEIVNLAEEDVTVLKLDGDKLVGEEDGEVSYLAKVDEFEAFDMESFMNSFSFDDESDETSDTSETPDGEWVTE